MPGGRVTIHGDQAIHRRVRSDVARTEKTYRQVKADPETKRVFQIDNSVSPTKITGITIVQMSEQSREALTADLKALENDRALVEFAMEDDRTPVSRAKYVEDLRRIDEKRKLLEQVLHP